MKKLARSLCCDDNLVPFHLWWMETRPKSQEFSKHFVEDYSSVLNLPFAFAILLKYQKDISARCIKHQRIQDCNWSSYTLAWNEYGSILAEMYSEHNDWIKPFLLQYFTLYSRLIQLTLRDLSIFSPNAGKYGPEKIRIRTPFTQCKLSQLAWLIIKLKSLTIFINTNHR